MIHIDLRPEPPDFDKDVRQPGQKALARNVEELPPHWRKCLPHLYDAYKGICAYLCVLIQPGTGARTVDHFAPKSSHRELAYEWSNYRLACSLMNSRKSSFEDVLDPTAVENDWFILDLSFLQILPNPNLDHPTMVKVQATINRLKLNDADCREAREVYFKAYLDKDDPMPFTLLEKWSPFVARELRRQGAER